ncbi:MAG: sigma-E factor negative regulatory protein [Betaproteobacteria bacterium]
MEKISAFMDGEVDGAQVQGQVARLKEDAALRGSWDAYHLIGDTLRGERKLMSRDFTEKFRAKLAAEPTVLAPRPRSPVPVMVRRFAMPVAASVGGMALVAWLALFNNPFAPPKENLAKAQPGMTQPPAMTLVPKTQLASEKVNDYLWAHREVSSSTPVQGVPSYVQTVSGQEAEEKR